MAFRIELDESVLEGVQRVAHDQLDRALESLTFDTGDDKGVRAGIHECRKRCKRIRAVVRLVRPALAGDRYTRSNEVFRDAARALSPYRDAHALRATFEHLIEAHVHQFAGVNIEPVRAELDRRAQVSTASLTDDSADLARARELLLAGRSVIDDWKLDTTGWEAIAGGVAKTYGRGRSALGSAEDAPIPRHFHLWRKRAKYTWSHLQLIQQSAPTLLVPLADAFKSLSDALGDAHDLAVLRDQFDADPEAFGGSARVEDVLVIVDGRRVDLERRSIVFGSRLYVEEPKQFARRLGTYWDLWHDLGPEPVVGEIADLST